MGFGQYNYCQNEHAFVPYFVTLCISRISLGSGGEATRSSRVLYLKLSSEEHILNLFCDTVYFMNKHGVRG